MAEHNDTNDLLDQLDGSEIAIIGMDCRFPGAANPRAYWRNLRDGVESIRSLDDAELDAAGVNEEERNHPSYVRVAAVLDDVDRFDAGFFGYTPKEAEVMDPQHRLFLETAWRALEDAGYDPETYPDAIGVFGGARSNTYLFNLAGHRELVASLGTFEIGLGNDLAFLTSGAAYKLGLQGPAVSVHTACSTSLVAVHMACQSLLIDECRMALAGGVAINVPHHVGYQHTPGSIFSPDGHCRAFDAEAKGTVFGSGVGLVVLKRLEDALVDGDTVRAVIRGSAVNNDGDRKASFTAPGVSGQEDVILDALAAAGLKASDISYVEAHGTGTALGDPIEVRALTKAFRDDVDDVAVCGLGSVKSNFGHLDAAAGIASLIKTVLALEHRELPATLHFMRPNPNIDFAHSPFYINAELRPWETDLLPRRAGVSSFGIGGANAHLILEEAPQLRSGAPPRDAALLPLSAKSEHALEAMVTQLGRRLEEDDRLNLADVAYTLQIGRKPFKHRRFVVASTVGEAAAALQSETEDGFGGYCEVAQRPVVFGFPGQGSQYPGMAANLYRRESVFREAVEACATLVEAQTGENIRPVLFLDTGPSSDDAVTRTDHVQIGLFVVEVALAALWRSWGVEPKTMIGHSIGEIVAAHLAGVLSLPDALSLVHARGALMQAQPTGAMLAVSQSEAETEALLGNDLSLAAVNGPRSCVVAGTEAAVEALIAMLVERDIEHRRLRVSHAFHSAMMEGVLAGYRRHLLTLSFSKPNVPFISNLTGTWITDAQAVDPDYWVSHLRHTVRFAAGMEVVLEDPNAVFLEVGPGATLGRFARQSERFGNGHDVLASLRQPREAVDDQAFSLRTLGKLWLAGVEVDWNALQGESRRHRISLPTYAFDHRQSYWIDAAPIGGASEAVEVGRRPRPEDWLYQPSWQRVAKARGLAGSTTKSTWLVFADAGGVAARAIERLIRSGQRVVRVDTGRAFACLGERHYALDPLDADGYGTLLDAVAEFEPTRLAHFWTLDSVPGDFDGAQNLGFYSLMWLAKALGARGETPCHLGVVSSGLHEVVGGETLVPERATLLGPCRVVPRELTHVRCLTIDIAANPDAAAERSMIDDVLAEIEAPADDTVVALRGSHRWVQRFEVAAMAPAVAEMPRLRGDGTYLITGGLGGVGHVLADHLASLGAVRLVLTGRRDVPDPACWDDWLHQHGEDAAQSSVAARVRKLVNLRAKGARVDYRAADAGDQEAMLALLADAEATYGPLNGVFHAAGVAGGGLIQVKERAEMEAVLRAKARGAWILDQFLADREIDFVIQVSSITSVLGELGQSDYCGANAYLDALAQARSGGATFVTAINWDTWREVGMTVDLIRDKKVPAEIALRLESEIVDGLDNHEGIDVLRRVLAQQHLPQVVVSTKDLHQQLRNAARFDLDHVLDLMRENAAGAQARPRIQKVYVAPSTETERLIVDIWQEVLGIEQIGVNDDFFDLGGHSLLATRLIARIRESLGVELTLTRFFETPSPASLAAQVDALAEGQNDTETQNILDMLAELSDEEAAAALAELEGAHDEVPA